MPLSEKQIQGRANCLVTASRVPDLFGEGKTSYFQLWHECAGLLEPEDVDTKATRWGNRLEPTIARGVAEDEGWYIRKVQRHLTLSWTDVLAVCKPFDATHAALAVLQGVRPYPLGASLDYEVAGSSFQPSMRGWIPLEIKAVGRYADRDWREGVPPDAVQLQGQTQVAADEAEAVAFAGLRSVTGPDVVVVPRHEPTIRIICQAVVELGLSLARHEPPPPDLDRTADVEAVLQLHRTVTDGKILDLRGDPKAEQILGDYRSISEVELCAKKEKDRLWAELLVYLGKDQADFHTLITNESKARRWVVGARDVPARHQEAYDSYGVYRRKG